MSVVTGVMLILGAGDWDETPVAEVQAWLRARGWGELREVADHAGGGKHPQFEAWSAGINYFLEVGDFAAFVLARAWRDPENVVLIVQPEAGVTKVYRPTPFDRA